MAVWKRAPGIAPTQGARPRKRGPIFPGRRGPRSNEDQVSLPGIEVRARPSNQLCAAARKHRGAAALEACARNFFFFFFFFERLMALRGAGRENSQKRPSRAQPGTWIHRPRSKNGKARPRSLGQGDISVRLPRMTAREETSLRNRKLRSGDGWPCLPCLSILAVSRSPAITRPQPSRFYFDFFCS